MNILMANANWYPSGGDWTYVSSVCDIYLNNGHNVIPFSMHNPKNIKTTYDKYFISSVNYTELNRNKNFSNVVKAIRKSIYSSEAKFKLNELLDEVKIDIAQLNNIHNIQTPSIIPVLKKRKIPIVWRVLDYKILCPNRTFLSNQTICEKCFKTKYYNCFLNKCKKNSYSASFLTTIESYFNKLMPYYNLVDCFSFQSEFSRDLFLKYGFDISKTIVIENPFHISDNINKNEETTDSIPYILYFGRISYEKGLFTLYNAMKSLKHIHLKVIGDGPDLEESIEFKKIHSIENIEFLGSLWGDALDPYIKNCEFVVLPSEWYEPNPYVVLQSFAFGKPIVATNIGGLSDMVINNFNGVLCNPNDSTSLSNTINELYHDKNKIYEMGNNSRKVVAQKYNSEKYYINSINLFERLIDNSKS